MLYGYIYVVTNLVNGKFYIGQHKLDKFDDSYYGSGKAIIQAVNKYGKDSFSTEVIEWCENKSTLDEREKFWISEMKNISGDLCYNIASGGNGGDVHFYKTEEEKIEFSQKMSRINKKRCSSQTFKEAASRRMTDKYRDKNERKNIQLS